MPGESRKRVFENRVALVTGAGSGMGLAAAKASAEAGASVALAEEPGLPVVRIAELAIDPARLDRFKDAVKEEMETSVRVEPGGLAIDAVAEKDDPARLRSFEIHADEAAFQDHIPSLHSRKYRTFTEAKVLSRKRIETVSVPLSATKK